MTVEEKLRAVQERLALLNPELAILFGSAARGKARPSSVVYHK
jgi:predicted nucleotidyltransferase